MRLSFCAALAAVCLFASASDAFAFGRRCGEGRPGLFGRIFQEPRCSASQSVPYTCPMTGANSCGVGYMTNPPAGFPVQYTTPGCSGGVCSPAGLPVNYGFRFGCPNGQCR